MDQTVIIVLVLRNITIFLNIVYTTYKLSPKRLPYNYTKFEQRGNANGIKYFKQKMFKSLGWFIYLFSSKR